ncbi:glycosyltransferase family 2 protein [Aporhodopirellula aestuarii]|uniref:Glycosyltransferase n=1 Tax=Aporhodopirellula aestuarii TaxID=2950107 RepID=A0ABT0UEC3_9BACT|nr:glycosyltransferase family 2 protein [Aporhodopirellula aestuarii]MCM2375243.1 glycosyltransferase [Aporhodopirellula aestuarii]
MSLPRISIVTPSYNQAGFLQETIRSVIEQDYPNLEYVVIDGGSSDGSVDIIKQYESRIAYWESAPDDGHGHAINKGFAKTSGEIMAWINSDDKYTPWAFQAVAEIFSKFPHVNWVVGFNGYWNSQGAMINAFRHPKNIYDLLVGNDGWIQQESVFWRRSLWEKAGGAINQDFRFMVDGELWTRFFLYDELYALDCVLGGYRIHTENRAIHNHDECLREMTVAIETMREKCPEQTLRIAKKLSRLKSAKRNWMMRHFPLQYLVSKYVWPDLYRSLSYKNLLFHNGEWREGTLPWSI